MGEATEAVGAEGVSRPERARELALALLVPVLLYGGWLRARHLTAPFDDGFRSVNAALYFARANRSFEDVGIGETRGFATIFAWPGVPVEEIRLEGRYQTAAQLTHPATYPLLVRATSQLFPDRVEVGLRALPLLSACLGLLLFARLAWRLLPPTGAVVATALLATDPMQAYFGVMTAAQSLVLAFACGMGLLLLDRLEHSRRPLALFGLFFCGCLLDWPFFLLAPGLAALALLHPRGGRRAALRLWPLLALGVLAFRLYLVHATWAAGSLEAFLVPLRSIVEKGAGETEVGSWWGQQAVYLRRWYADPLPFAPLLVLLPIGLLGPGLPPARRRALLGGAALFLVGGGLDVALFPAHSGTHDFWGMGLAGGFALLGGAACSAGDRARWRGTVTTLALLAALAAVGQGSARTLAAQDRELEREVRSRAEEIARFALPGGVLLTEQDLRVEAAYIPSQVLPGLRSTRDGVVHDELLEALTAYQEAGCRAPLVLVLSRDLLEPDHPQHRLALSALAFSRALPQVEHFERDGWAVWRFDPR